MEDELKGAVLLVFANKQDLPNALSVGELTEKLSLNQYRNKPVSTSQEKKYVSKIMQRDLKIPERMFRKKKGCSRIVKHVPRDVVTPQWHVQSTCATHGDGLYEGLDWLSKELSK